MTTLEKFDRRVIELIHGMSYEEAVKKEITIEKEGCQAGSQICGKKDIRGIFVCDYCRRWGGEQRVEHKAFPVTIGRVMQAFDKVEAMIQLTGDHLYLFQEQFDDEPDSAFWQLTKENGAETTSADIWEKSPETIKKLYELIK